MGRSQCTSGTSSGPIGPRSPPQRSPACRPHSPQRSKWEPGQLCKKERIQGLSHPNHGLRFLLSALEALDASQTLFPQGCARITQGIPNHVSPHYQVRTGPPPLPPLVTGEHVRALRQLGKGKVESPALKCLFFLILQGLPLLRSSPCPRPNLGLSWFCVTVLSMLCCHCLFLPTSPCPECKDWV